MEQININTTDENNPFEEELVVDKINHQLCQKSRLKGVVREFSIFNDSHLNQVIKREHRKKREFHISLALLDAKPQHERVIAYDWLITSIIGLFATLLMIYICWFSAMQVGSTNAYIITAFTISFCFITFLTAMLKTDNRIQVFSHYGRVPIIEFFKNNPSKNALEEFVGALQNQIENNQQNSGLEIKELLSLELKELRRLHNQSIITQAQYELAKINIFKNEAFKSQSA